MSKNWQILNGTYGSSHTPCTVLVYHDPSYGYWYCVEGSKNVNLTYQELYSGIDVELIEDVDCFTNGSEIETIDELIAAIEEQ